MPLAPFDYFLAFLLIGGLGAWAHREHQRLEVQLARGMAGARMAGYRRVLAVQWPLVGMLGLHWVLRQREASLLGLGLPLHWRFGLGMLLALAGVAFLYHQLRQVRRFEEARVEARAAVRDLRALLPQTPRELDAFMRVSLTAGICEELLYRGFLAWFLAHWMPFWVAMTVGGVLFGIAHLYQGPSGVLKTGAVGIALGGLTLLAQSIYPAMILHFAVDALNGQLAYVALTTPPEWTEPPESDGEPESGPEEANSGPAGPPSHL